MVDVCLLFGGTRVSCHKLILVGTCEYFKRIFFTNMSEKHSKEVNIKGISGNIGILVVDFLYSRNIEITVDNAQALLEAGEMLILDNLKQKVEQFLIGQLEAQNCISILNLGRLYELKTLVESTRQFLTD
ncbi:hypothetical protein CAPTEDRAFT_133847, partial [Capitella teleta]